MKAFQAETLNSLADYREVDLPMPEPRDGEIRIRVKACGVGYVDALIALGKYQVKPQMPFIPGIETAGIVDAVGPGVSNVKLGDRVIAVGNGSGGFAEFAVVPAIMCVKMPDALGYAEGAALRVNYSTALHGLEDRGAIKPGEKLLVFGAAGGVGIAAVQIGKILGAEVIAAASTEEKRAFAKAHGADHVIDTNPEGWRDRLKALCGTVDVILDPVCGPLFEAAFRSLSWRGRHLVVGFVGGEGRIAALPSNLTIMKGSALIGVDIRQYLLREMPAYLAMLARLMTLIEEGKLAPVAGRSFSFAEAPQALEYALTGKGLGKTVLTIP